MMGDISRQMITGPEQKRKNAVKQDNEQTKHNYKANMKQQDIYDTRTIWNTDGSETDELHRQ